MVAKIPIPEEVRWQLSARIAAILPALYRAAFVDIVGEEYDRIEQQVWVVLAQEAKTVAKNLRAAGRNRKGSGINPQYHHDGLFWS
jgi:hypothetical protein